MEYIDKVLAGKVQVKGSPALSLWLLQVPSTSTPRVLKDRLDICDTLSVISLGANVTCQ